MGVTSYTQYSDERVQANTMLYFLLLCMLINFTKCQEHLKTTRTVYAALEKTTDFFQQLKLDYAHQTASEDVLAEVDDRVAEYIKNVTEPISNRKKREVPGFESNEGIEVLEGFLDVWKFTWSKIRDVAFFSFENEADLGWFAAVLDDSKIALYHLHNNSYDRIGIYPQTNGKRIIVDSCTYGVLLIIQHQDGSIVVLRLIRDNENYNFYSTQDFESYDVTHLTTWHGMNKLYLGVASHSNISIYTWLGEHFDRVQVIQDLGADKLLPFSIKGFMHLVATGTTTTILRYSVRTSEFLVTQRLPSSQDISSFHLKKGHHAEHFLVLSSEASIILYKEIHNRFVPFQRIPTGISTVSLTVDKSILLLSLHENTVSTYQYDGWKFVKLKVKIFNAKQIRIVTFRGEESLLVELEDDVWMLKQPTWKATKSWESLQEEIREWCVRMKERAREIPEYTLDLNSPLRIMNGHIGQLVVHNINGHDSHKLENVTSQYEKVASRLQDEIDAINTRQLNETLIIPSLNAKKVKVNCKSKCKITRVNTDQKIKFSNKIRESEDTSKDQNFNFDHLGCPVLGLPIEKITVKNSINGVSLADLQENLLKTVGNQEVSGEHIFSNVNTINAFLPLDIATLSTKQVIQAHEIRARELNVIDGGLLLPLNGSSTTMTGSIKARRVKVKGSILLKGPITKDGVRYSPPVTLITEPLIVIGDRSLQNVTIESRLDTQDVVNNEGKSMKDILENVISLRDEVSVPLRLSSENVNWRNITLSSHPNWITARSEETIVITGTKRVPNNITLTNHTFQNLQLPKITTKLCGLAAIAPEIKTATVTMGNIKAKKIVSKHVFGDLGRTTESFGSESFESIDVLRKQVYRKITVQNVSVSHMESLDLEELEKHVNAWSEPGVFKGSIETTNLSIENLRAPVRFSPIRLPQVVRNVVSKGITYAGRINNIHLMEFLRDVVKVSDMLSLGNITFSNGFASNYTYCSHCPFNVTNFQIGSNFGTKRISGNLETTALNLPHSFAYSTNELPSNIIIDGSASFSREPTVQNINKLNLKETLKKIWTMKNPTVLSGKNLHIKNISIEGNIILNSSSGSLKSKTWNDLSERLLSKSKSQEIAIPVSIKNAEIPAVIGSSVSNVNSSILYLNDMFQNTLRKNGKQEVRARWKLDKMTVLGKLHIKGKINGMNLATDVVRHDRDVNIITGKKTVLELATENLYGLKFQEWSANALTKKNKGWVMIKGRKSFRNVSITNLGVFGTVMGQRIEEALLISADQNVIGAKTIDGSLDAPALIVNGFVNDVNLTDLVSFQLKKHKSSQRIKTKVALEGSLKILGNLTVNGLYDGVELKHFDDQRKMTPVAQELLDLLELAKTINIALQSRAIYIDKLETVDQNAINLAEVDKPQDNIVINEGYQCEVKNVSLLCNDKTTYRFDHSLDSSEFIVIKLVLLNNVLFVVSVKPDYVSIHSYNRTTDTFSSEIGLHLPNISQAFVEPVMNSLWIVLRLPSQTLIFRYETWGELQEHILPPTTENSFAVSRAPNDQFLLLQSDGIWDLDGVGIPRKIVGAPLRGKIETMIQDYNLYVTCKAENNTTVMKARYVGS